jgi:hypothetical protein
MAPSRKVQRYVAAKRDYELLAAQRAAYPELKDSEKHIHALTEARAVWLSLMRALTGGELAAARALERTLDTKEES